MNPSDTAQKNQELSQELEQKISSIQVSHIEEETKSMAVSLSLPYADLKSYPIDTNAVLLISEQDARTGQLAVISKSGHELTIALKDPKNSQAVYVVENLKNRGYTITFIIVSPLSLALAWQRYALKKEKLAETPGLITITDAQFKDIAEKIKNFNDLKNQVVNTPLTEIVTILLAGGLNIKASDIHFEPQEKSTRLRYRLDGVLQDVTEIQSEEYEKILARLKLLSGLKLNIHDTPQDGRFTIRRDDRDIEVRVSILPGGYGENIVMRLLDPTSINKELVDLGMRQELLDRVQKLLQKTTGAILTTGPTGSGKTTTLYAFVKHLNTPDQKIITIEDPIEYHIEGISQTQVDETAGYTFAGGLRSIMRQDPDVILVGEIRDTETAEIALQAALTGHLVFSTLHTNNAAGAIPRLIDLGVRPITIAPAIKATMAQRLVRRICEDCKKKSLIKAEDLELLKKNLPSKAQEITEQTEIYYPAGCEKCGDSGYKGRIGVYELFEIDGDLEKLILTSPAISQVQELAVQKGMVTLLQDGLIRVLEGITSIEEVMRVVGE